MRRALMAMLAIGSVAGLMHGLAQAQTTFSEIAGKWAGVNTSNGMTIELLVDSEGKFSISSPRGSDFGTGKLDGGSAVFLFTKNVGNVAVKKKGDALEGLVTLGGLSTPVTFNRKK